MADEGRRPSYDQEGNIRGYRSRPGAPTVDPLQFGVANMTSGSGGTPMDAWRSFFQSATPVAAPTVEAPQLGQANINPNGTATSLIPEAAPDAAGMAGVASRPFAAPKVPSAQPFAGTGGNFGSTAQNLPSGLTLTSPKHAITKTFKSPYGTLSTRPAGLVKAENERGVLKNLFRRMDADYESLFPDAFNYAGI